MRVTEMMIFSGATTDSARARERLETAVRQASTGLRVAQPGDDPVAASLMVTHQSEVRRFEALDTAAGRANDELATADHALGALTDVLHRARELSLTASNETWSAAERLAAADEVTGLFQQALSALNSRVGDRYVFGGTVDNTPAFDGSGNYQGDAAVRRLEVAPGILQDVSVRADVAVKGVGGGVDVLATLQALSTALKTNSTAGISATIDPLAASINQVTQARSGAGAAQAVLTAAQSASVLARDNATKQVSDLGDADAIDAATRLSLAQRALESALTASAQGFKLSLLNFMK